MFVVVAQAEFKVANVCAKSTNGNKINVVTNRILAESKQLLLESESM
jgi:hypothetical protein